MSSVFKNKWRKNAGSGATADCPTDFLQDICKKYKLYSYIAT